MNNVPEAPQPLLNPEAQIAALLLVYPSLAPLVTTFGLPEVKFLEQAPFEALATAIVHQQISTKAATTITNRLWERCEDRLEPTTILNLSDEDLQGVGISKQKRGYLRSLAQHFLDHPELITQLHTLDDAAIIHSLAQVKGIGVWSVQMYLLFELWRPDVWPLHDLGIQRGVGRYMGLDDKATPTQVEAFGQPAVGMRSLLAWYMWRLSSKKQTDSP